MDQPTILAKAEQLRAGLNELAELYDTDQWSAAGPTRTRLNMLWGEVGEALITAGMATEWDQAGRTFPIIETALSRYSDGVNRQAMDHALDSLEITIGRIAGFPPTWKWSPGRSSAPAVVATDVLPKKSSGFPRFQAGLVVGAGLGWVFCQRQDQVIGAFTSPEGVRLGKLTLVVVAVLAGILSANLLTSLVHERGWRGAFKTAPVASTFYLVLALLGVYVSLTVATGRG